MAGLCMENHVKPRHLLFLRGMRGTTALPFSEDGDEAIPPGMSSQLVEPSKGNPLRLFLEPCKGDRVDKVSNLGIVQTVLQPGVQ